MIRGDSGCLQARCGSIRSFRTQTVSTYIVGFLSFLAEYFSRDAFAPMFIGFWRGLLTAPNFRECDRAATARERTWHGVTELVWFRLRRVRERAGACQTKCPVRSIHYSGNGAGATISKASAIERRPTTASAACRSPGGEKAAQSARRIQSFHRAGLFPSNVERNRSGWRLHRRAA